jgi:N-acetylated-alpha-linked acidic dipeptidase
VDHYLRFQDPDLAYAAALAKVGGRAVMRLSEADVLPFSFARSADRIGTYVGEVEKVLETHCGKARRRQRHRLQGRTRPDA